MELELLSKVLHVLEEKGVVKEIDRDKELILGLSEIFTVK